MSSSRNTEGLTDPVPPPYNIGKIRRHMEHHKDALLHWELQSHDPGISFHIRYLFSFLQQIAINYGKYRFRIATHDKLLFQ